MIFLVADCSRPWFGDEDTEAIAELGGNGGRLRCLFPEIEFSDYGAPKRMEVVG